MMMASSFPLQFHSDSLGTSTDFGWVHAAAIGFTTFGMENCYKKVSLTGSFDWIDVLSKHFIQTSVCAFFNTALTFIPSELYIAKRDTHWRRTILSRTRFAVYLLYIQGANYTLISSILAIGHSTACQCVHQCTYTICQTMFSTYIRLSTNQMASVNMRRLQEKTGIPGIYAAIDGIYILIKQ